MMRSVPVNQSLLVLVHAHGDESQGNCGYDPAEPDGISRLQINLRFRHLLRVMQNKNGRTCLNILTTYMEIRLPPPYATAIASDSIFW
jgi:hypothetical protein